MVPAGTLAIEFRLGSLTEETAREKGSRQGVGARSSRPKLARTIRLEVETSLRSLSVN